MKTSLLSHEINRVLRDSHDSEKDCIAEFEEYIKQRKGGRKQTLVEFMRLAHEFWQVHGNAKDLAKMQAYCEKMSEMLEKEVITL